MRSAWCAVTMVMMSAAASAQTPLPAVTPLAAVAPLPAETAPADPALVTNCAENPFKPECGALVITPGAPSTGLKPQGGGIAINGLRPMDKPSFDRNSLRLPK